jgi:hypothetical protein
LGLPSDATIEEIGHRYKQLSNDIQDRSLPWEKLKEILWSYYYIVNCISEGNHKEDIIDGAGTKK